MKDLSPVFNFFHQIFLIPAYSTITQTNTTHTNWSSLKSHVTFGKYVTIASQIDFSREGNGSPLQYSCLENSVDGGAWWHSVHGVTKSWTSHTHTHTHTHTNGFLSTFLYVDMNHSLFLFISMVLELRPEYSRF